MGLRSEIEELGEQVRILQLRDATRQRDLERQSYKLPLEFSPRGIGYQPDDEAGE